MNALDTFKSEDAAQYWCQVEYYAITHTPMLLLKILFKRYVGYIQFWSVQHINAPMNWQGLDFQIASPQMTLEFARNHNRFDTLDDEVLIDNFKLYHIDRPRLQVQIVAMSVFQSDKIPKEKYYYIPSD